MVRHLTAHGEAARVGSSTMAARLAEFRQALPERLRLGPPRLVVAVAAWSLEVHPGYRGIGAGVVVEVTGSMPMVAESGHATVTAADMVAGHVVLDISCLDRLYLTGYVAGFQAPGGVIYFLHDHLGKPIASPALFEPIGEKFRREIRDWAQASGIPVIRFKAGERKADVMKPYLDAAAAAGRSAVVAVGCAQEFQSVWTARRRDTDPGMCPQFSFIREQRRVSVFYVYIFDAKMGPGFIKICTYFPYPVKVWVNGHEWAKRQALVAGVGFTELSNGFASCEEPALLQRICDSFGPGTVQAWFDRWMARIPLPLTSADRDAGYWWDLSMRQIETPAPWSSTAMSMPARSSLQDQDRPVLRPGHPECVLQELPAQAVPERRRRAAHRNRRQQPQGPGLQPPSA
jgi:hypothetical protein